MKFYMASLQQGLSSSRTAQLRLSNTAVIREFSCLLGLHQEGWFYSTIHHARWQGPCR